MRLLMLLICAYSAAAQTIPNPILFVTQVPAFGFTSVTQTFSNHNAWVENAPRGGDLMITYPDGSMRNLTRECGYGEPGEMQGKNAIAVRQPCVHWSGTKALFSMVQGGPVRNWAIDNPRWQIYEITGIGQGQKASITKVPGQDSNYNYVSPIYGSDDAIIFTTDRPITGKTWHYPPLDEYENAQVVSGLWKMNPDGSGLTLLQHSPSGSFYPMIDSYGRILYTRWDHLQRDQQADADRAGGEYGTFNYASEDSLAQALDSRKEYFPEPRVKENPDYNPVYAPHAFNQFFPWEINQDGTEEETVNHVGRHEWGGSYSEGSIIADKNLHYIIPKSWVKNTTFLGGDAGPFQIIEDPLKKGEYLAAISPEFGRETSGQLIRFVAGAGINPEDMIITPLTHPATRSSAEDGQNPSPYHSGRYRNPVPLGNGSLLAVHTYSPYANKNEGSTQAPRIRYSFRIRFMEMEMIDGMNLYKAGKALNQPIVRSIKYYNGNDYIVQRTDTLWELDPVEVKPRTIPPLRREANLAGAESEIFAAEGVNESLFREWMKKRNLALIVSRNVASRDRNDDTQPFNLRLPGGAVHGNNQGTIYDIAHFQIVQADLLRAQGGIKNPREGRRVTGVFLHDSLAVRHNAIAANAPEGSVPIWPDGSVAAFIPAHRAMSWQSLDPQGNAVVRERYWVSAQPGEIRVCGSCHGVNKSDQAGMLAPVNKPQALQALLSRWKQEQMNGVAAHEQQNPEQLEIIPQPADGYCLVETMQKGDLQIQIMDLMGGIIAHYTASGISDIQDKRRIPLNIPSIPAGVYVVESRSRNSILRRSLIICH